MKTSKEIITLSQLKALNGEGDGLVRGKLNNQAMNSVCLSGSTNSASGAFVLLMKAWGNYADAWQRANGKQGLGELDGYNGLSEDGYIGPIWAGIGTDIRRLLDGDIGNRLEAYRCSEIITEILDSHGFTHDGEPKKDVQ